MALLRALPLNLRYYTGKQPAKLAAGCSCVENKQTQLVCSHCGNSMTGEKKKYAAAGSFFMHRKKECFLHLQVYFSLYAHTLNHGNQRQRKRLSFV